MSAQHLDEIILNFTLRDKKLKSDVSSLIIVLDNIEVAYNCATSCLIWSSSASKTCQSVNYNANLKKCELLSKNAEKYDSALFKHSPGWVYYGQKLVSDK